MPRPEPEDPRAHPRDLVAGAAAAYGTGYVARWCADLLAARADPYDPDLPSLAWLAGGATAWEAASSIPDRYWPRVWGARGLLYAWAPEAAPSVHAGLADPAWRVREMCAKVARLRELGETADTLAGLVGDAVPHVRAAAARALGTLGEGEHAPALHTAAADPEHTVRKAAATALGELRERLDRDL